MIDGTPLLKVPSSYHVLSLAFASSVQYTNYCVDGCSVKHLLTNSGDIRFTSVMMECSCVNGTRHPLPLLSPLDYFICSHSHQNASHYFSPGPHILCFPDFRNNLVEPQSLGPLPLHPIYSSVFPFGFLLHRGPLKIGLRRAGGCFLSNDGIVNPLPPHPAGIWDRERERTWRAR